MTDKQTLLALAASCEAAAGPDRELDCLVWCDAKGITGEWQGNLLVAGEEGVIGYIDPGEHQRNFSCNRADQGWAGIPAYTASLDAAMTLVDPEAFWQVGHDGEGRDPSMFAARVFDPMIMKQPCTSVAETPALSLCAAALRARAGDGG